MKVDFEDNNELNEEIGYSIISRSNKLRANGEFKLAFKMRTIGREFIEHSRNIGEEKEFEDTLNPQIR